MKMGAIISDDLIYRYKLWRIWKENKPLVGYCMLNPSTADHTEDDPTIRRCIGFAKRWNMGGIIVVNLFAIRANNPKEIFKHENPIGPDNEQYLSKM